MIDSLHAWIACRGRVIDWNVAKASTVAKRLATAQPLSEYQVCYHVGTKPHLVSADAFLERYHAWCRGDVAVFV